MMLTLALLCYVPIGVCVSALAAHDDDEVWYCGLIALFWPLYALLCGLGILTAAASVLFEKVFNDD